MTEPSLDRMNDRDMPFLRYVAPLLDDNPGAGVSFDQIEEATTLSAQQVRASATAWRDDGVITAHFNGGMTGGTVLTISAEGRRRVGIWPTEEIAADRLLEAVKAFTTDERLDETERSRWRGVLEDLRSASRDLLVQVASGVITGQIPH